MTGPVLKFANGVTVKDGVITAILSTEAVDRDGDVVRLDGWDLANFSRAPRLMSCHDYSSLTKQIGEWRNVRVDTARGALIGEPHYYTGQGNPEADWAYFLATQGQATYSVGFNPLEAEPRKGAGSTFTRQELLECSHVPIPANQEAVQLMAKAFQHRAGQPSQQKWDSSYMGEPGGYGPLDTHCLVPGCDDASQIYAPICSEHLKVLMNAEAEPPGSPPDDDEVLMALADWARKARRETKAGRTISAANMNQLHTAMDAIHAVHDGACKGTGCAYNEDNPEPPASERDKQAKAAGEGSSSEGGATVSDSGTHGAFGTAGSPKSHTHDHQDGSAGMHGGNGHAHTHAGDADHSHAHGKSAEDLEAMVLRIIESKSHSELPDSAFACIDPGGEVEDGKTRPLSLRHYPHHTASGGVDKGLLRSALSRIADSSNEQCGKAHLAAHAKDLGIGENAEDKAKAFSTETFGASLEDAMTKALEAAGW